MHSASRTPPRQVWDFAKYTFKQNRDDLVRQLNGLIGPPTLLGQSLQTAFVLGEMEPHDVIEFAKVCQEIIASKTRWL